MSGPQGSDPAQPWTGQQPPPSDPPPAWQQPPAPEQPPGEAQAWQQPPAYNPQQYPQYQQPAYNPQQYPQSDQYGQQPTAYGPTSYQQPQYGQYGQPPQYGQPGQPGPYGQPPQYGQPGQPGQQFSPHDSSATEEGSKKSLTLVMGLVGALVVVIIAVVGVLGFWKPGFFVETRLDVDAAQTGVRQVLSDETNGYGAKNVQNVKCNDGASPQVKKGDTFTCDVSIDGTKRQVTVTFQDDQGTYEVGRPK